MARRVYSSTRLVPLFPIQTGLDNSTTPCGRVRGGVTDGARRMCGLGEALSPEPCAAGGANVKALTSPRSPQRGGASAAVSPCYRCWRMRPWRRSRAWAAAQRVACGPCLRSRRPSSTSGSRRGPVRVHARCVPPPASVAPKPHCIAQRTRSDGVPRGAGGGGSGGDLCVGRGAAGAGDGGGVRGSCLGGGFRRRLFYCRGGLFSGGRSGC